MKIRTKISIVFSTITSLILILFGGTIYWFEKTHQEIDFRERLKERVEITERFFLEKENFSPEEYEKIRTQFLHILPQETEEVIALNDNGKPLVFKHNYSNATIQQMLNRQSYSIKDGAMLGESKKFKIKGKEYLIIVTAIDEIGKQNLRFLFKRISILILFSVPLIFLISFYFTKRALLPISKKIQRANQMSASNLEQRLEVINPNDELGQLAIAFNHLLDRLEQAFKAQKSFISNASHEIKNPLTAIIGEGEVALTKTRTAKEYQTSIAQMLDNAEAMNTTVSNLLQLSKINANEGGVVYSDINFSAFLTTVLENYNYLNPNHQIQLVELTPELIIQGNQGLLKTAIINLLDNACKYSNNQKVEVSLIKEGNKAKLKIVDKGIGIPKEELKKVQAPFYRAKNTFDFGGSGIGLSLVNKIVLLHKGELNIQSEEGKGTTVIVFF